MVRGAERWPPASSAAPCLQCAECPASGLRCSVDSELSGLAQACNGHPVLCHPPAPYSLKSPGSVVRRHIKLGAQLLSCVFNCAHWIIFHSLPQSSIQSCAHCVLTALSVASSPQATSTPILLIWERSTPHAASPRTASPTMRPPTLEPLLSAHALHALAQ